MSCMWSMNMCEECLSSSKKGNERANSSKSFEIGRIVLLYTLVQLPYLSYSLSVNALYNGKNSIHLQYMNPYGWANHVLMSWLNKIWKKKWYQITFLFIIIVVSNMMNMYRLTKMNGMSMWSSNVCDECPSSLENGNKQASSSYTFEILMDSYLVHLVQLAHIPCILSVDALYTCTFIYTSNAMCAYG